MESFDKAAELLGVKRVGYNQSLLMNVIANIPVYYYKRVGTGYWFTVERCYKSEHADFVSVMRHSPTDELRAGEKSLTPIELLCTALNCEAKDVETYLNKYSKEIMDASCRMKKFGL